METSSSPGCVDLRELTHQQKPRLWLLPARLDVVMIYPTRLGVGRQICTEDSCQVYIYNSAPEICAHGYCNLVTARRSPKAGGLGLTCFYVGCESTIPFIWRRDPPPLVPLAQNGMVKEIHNFVFYTCRHTSEQTRGTYV